MDCKEVRQLAEAFVSEQLSVEANEAVVAHLEQCAACRAEIDGLRRLREATRAAFARATDLQLRPEFAAAVAARLRSEGDRTSGRRQQRVWLAIAASVLLVLGAAWLWRASSLERFAELLHAAVGDHRFCALTFALEEKPIPLDEAARRYGGVYAQMQTIEPTTPRLSGGPLSIVDRHSCVFGGRRFSHIVFRYKEQLVSLLVTEHGGDGSGQTPTLAPVTDGLHAVTWRGPQHAVFVVSSLSDDDVQEVARAMAGPLAQALGRS